MTPSRVFARVRFRTYRTFRPDCPGDIAAFLRNALAQSSGVRPPTADAFAAAVSTAFKSSFGRDIHDAMFRNGVPDV